MKHFGFGSYSRQGAKNASSQQYFSSFAAFASLAGDAPILLVAALPRWDLCAPLWLKIRLLYFSCVRLGALSFGGEIFFGASRAYPAVSNDSVA